MPRQDRVRVFQFRSAERRKLVDCRQMIKVYVEINPHEIKTIDDQKEELPDGKLIPFSVI